MAASTFQWALRAFQQHGNLWIEWSTTAPFRAQQGQISVYKGTTFKFQAPMAHMRTLLLVDMSNPSLNVCE